MAETWYGRVYYLPQMYQTPPRHPLHRAVEPSATSVELSAFEPQNSSFSSCGTAGAGVSAGPTGVLGDVVSPSTPAAAAAGAVPLTLGWVELTGGIPAVGRSDGLAKAEMIGTLGDSLSGSWTGAANPGMSSGVAALYDGPYPWASSDGLAW